MKKKNHLRWKFRLGGWVKFIPNKLRRQPSLISELIKQKYNRKTESKYARFENVQQTNTEFFFVRSTIVRLCSENKHDSQKPECFHSVNQKSNVPDCSSTDKHCSIAERSTSTSSCSITDCSHTVHYSNHSMKHNAVTLFLQVSKFSSFERFYFYDQRRPSFYKI